MQIHPLDLIQDFIQQTFWREWEGWDFDILPDFESTAWISVLNCVLNSELFSGGSLAIENLYLCFFSFCSHVCFSINVNRCFLNAMAATMSNTASSDFNKLITSLSPEVNVVNFFYAVQWKLGFQCCPYFSGFLGWQTNQFPGFQPRFCPKDVSGENEKGRTSKF